MVIYMGKYVIHGLVIRWKAWRVLGAHLISSSHVHILCLFLALWGDETMPKRACPFEDSFSPEAKVQVGPGGVRRWVKRKEVYGELTHTYHRDLGWWPLTLLGITHKPATVQQPPQHVTSSKLLMFSPHSFYFAALLKLLRSYGSSQH